MVNTIDTRFAIAESDILQALTGIVNAHLADGIADGAGNVHPISVVIWRNMGDATKLQGEESLAVIVHVDGMSVAPFGGSIIYVRLADLSHAATFIVVRAERLAAEELDRQEAEEVDAVAFGAVASSALNEAIHELANEAMAQVRANTQKGYAAGYQAFCDMRNIVEDHPASRRQYRAWVQRETGSPVPAFVKLGA